MSSETFDRLLSEAKCLALELLARPRVPGRNLPFAQGIRLDESPLIPPKSQGVYLIAQIDGTFIYVGKANNLRKRISASHLSGGKRDGKDFRDKMAESLNIPSGPELRQWLRENCAFSWIVIPRSEMCNIVEHLLVAWLRDEKHPIKND
jgi:hypothetical protein